MPERGSPTAVSLLGPPQGELVVWGVYDVTPVLSCDWCRGGVLRHLPCGKLCGGGGGAGLADAGAGAGGGAHGVLALQPCDYVTTQVHRRRAHLQPRSGNRTAPVIVDLADDTTVALVVVIITQHHHDHEQHRHPAHDPAHNGRSPRP
jgi:hypothetical protein